MKKVTPYVPLIILLILSILVWSLGWQHYLNFESFKAHHHTIELFIIKHYGLSVLIFACLYIACGALSIPGATLLTVGSGFLFGQMMGVMISVISATLGATLLFLSARLASTDLLKKKAGGWVKKMQDGFRENAFSYLMTLRLIPLFPFVAINLVAALLQIPLRTFFFGTLIGIIPGSFVFASIGVGLHEVIEQPNFHLNLILNPPILMALIGLGVLSLLPAIYNHYHKKRKRQKIDSNLEAK